MPVSYRQPYLKTLPNKYLQQLTAGTWGAKGLIAGNMQVPAATGNGGTSIQGNIPSQVFMNAFFNSFGLMTQTYASAPYSAGLTQPAVPGVAIDANGWPTAAHGYAMTQGNVVAPGYLTYPFSNGKIPPGTYYVYFNSTGATATTVSAAAGSGWTFGTPTVTGSAGNWTTNVQVTVPNNNSNVQGILFNGGAQNQCMPLDGTNPAAQSSPATYVANVCNKNNAAAWWPPALAQMSQFNCMRNMANAGAASQYVGETSGATGSTSATRVKSLVNVAAEGDLTTTVQQKMWSLETWVSLFSAIKNYTGSQFTRPWHCWPGDADSTYATDLANLINANGSFSTTQWVHELGDETNVNYYYPFLGLARGVLDTQAIVYNGTPGDACCVWATTWQTTSGSPNIVYTPTAYPVAVGDVLNVGLGRGASGVPDPYNTNFGQSGVTVTAGPTSVGGGKYQITVNSNAASTLYGHYSWFVNNFMTAISGNGTTATVTLVKLPTFATVGSHSVIVGSDSGWSTSGAVTATISGTGPWSLTFPSTKTGTTIGFNFAIYFNTTSPVLTALSADSYNPSYGTLNQAWYVAQLYSWRAAFIAAGRTNDRWLINEVDFTPNYNFGGPPSYVAIPASQYSTPPTTFRYAAAINGGDASWACAAIQPYFSAPDPLLSVNNTVVSSTLASANALKLSFPSGTGQVVPYMQVTGSLITGQVLVGPYDGGVNFTVTGPNPPTSTPVASVPLIYSTGASSIAGTANLTFTNTFKAYITQVINPQGVSKSIIVYVGGAGMNHGATLASATFGGSAVSGVAGVTLQGPVFGTPAFYGAGGSAPNIIPGAACYLSAFVASVGSAASPAIFTPYQPTWTYTTDSPAIVAAEIGMILCGNYGRNWTFMGLCAEYGMIPMAYEGGFQVDNGTVPTAGPGAGIFGYYTPYMICDPNMYQAQELEYTSWFGIGGDIHAPINTGPDIIANPPNYYTASWASNAVAFNGNTGWGDTTSVGIKAVLATGPLAATYDPLFAVTPGVTTTQNFSTVYYRNGSLAFNSAQVLPQQPLATDMMYGGTGGYVDTYWCFSATQNYTLTVSGSDTAGGTVNLYIVKANGNVLLTTGGALNLPSNGTGSSNATVPGNSTNLTHNFTAGNYIIRTQVASGSGNTGLCHLTIAG